MLCTVQKDEPTEYKILNRAIFYVSRLVSSQKERDFGKKHAKNTSRILPSEQLQNILNELEMAKKRDHKIMIIDEAINKVPRVQSKEIQETE